MLQVTKSEIAFSVGKKSFNLDRKKVEEALEHGTLAELIQDKTTQKGVAVSTEWADSLAQTIQSRVVNE